MNHRYSKMMPLLITLGVFPMGFAHGTEPDQAIPPISDVVQKSVELAQHQEAQGMLDAGHRLYQQQQLVEAEAVFTDLRVYAKDTLLEVEALRMVAQIRTAMQQPHAALQAAEEALHVWTSLPDADAHARQTALISFAPRLASHQESHGLHAQAKHTSELVLAELSDVVYLRREELRRAGRMAMALGDLQSAKLQYEAFLTEFPDEGWTNGVRLEVERRLRICEGMSWGLGTPAELQFCREVLADPRFRQEQSRYRIGRHLVTLLTIQHSGTEAESIAKQLLEEMSQDREFAKARNDSEHAIRLQQQAEGELRISLIFLYVQQGNNADAFQQLAILQGDPGFGHLAERTAASFGLSKPMDRQP